MRFLRYAWAAAALLGLLGGVAAAAAPLKVPRRRGPLKPHEMRRIHDQLRDGAVKEIIDEAERAGRAMRGGKGYTSDRYELVPVKPSDGRSRREQRSQFEYFLREKQPRSGEAHGDVVASAGITKGGNAHVTVDVSRVESGKSSPTKLTLTFEPVETFDSKISWEARTSSANAKAADTRGALRFYEGANWSRSKSWEAGGSKRKPASKRASSAEFEPGGRMSLWRDGTPVTAAGKLSVH
jgi:hypothetical protein